MNRTEAEDKIRLVLVASKWSQEEIEQSIAALKNGPVPQTDKVMLPNGSVLRVNLENISVTQVLEYLGGLIIILAGVIFVGINWEQWGGTLRVAAILLPLILVYSVGVWLWQKAQSANHSIVFIFTGALLFPLFLTVLISELNLFPSEQTSLFGATVSGLTLVLYLSHYFIFKSPVWAMLCPSAALFLYYFSLKLLGVDEWDNSSVLFWAYFLASLVLMLIGYLYEQAKKQDYSKYPYLLGFIVLTFSLIGISIQGSFFTVFVPGRLIDSPSQEMIGFSTVISGLIFLVLGLLTSKLKTLGLEEAGKYISSFHFATVLFILTGIFSLGTGGAKIIYEGAFLIACLGFIFGSIATKSRAYLYVGTIFLIIFIFDIGSEYFQNQVGWPITLFVSGLISMGIGLGIARVQKQFFKSN